MRGPRLRAPVEELSARRFRAPTGVCAKDGAQQRHGLRQEPIHELAYLHRRLSQLPQPAKLPEAGRRTDRRLVAEARRKVLIIPAAPQFTHASVPDS